MERAIRSREEPTTEAEFEVAADALLEELSRLDRQMDRRYAEIERLKVETRVVGAHTDAVLAQVIKQLDDLQKLR
jgi:hypothetical protein